MKTVRKFLFENDFDSGSEALTKDVARKKTESVTDHAVIQSPEKTFTETEYNHAVADARAKGLKEGQIKGKLDNQNQVETQIANTLTNINSQIADLSKKISQDRTTILREASSLALAIIRKMLPEFTRRGGLAEIESTIEQCLVDQRNESRISIRVPEELLPELRAVLTKLTVESHFDGQANLLGDLSLKSPNCSIEWSNGGLIRDSEDIWRDISAALNRYLQAEGIVAMDIGEEPTTNTILDTKDVVDGSEIFD